jgi:2-oxoglutarate dehydrogenase E1 component
MVIDDAKAREHPESIRRVVLCSGKVYVDLEGSEAASRTNEVAVVRVEMLHPFPDAELRQVLEQYTNLSELIWLQEEPRNMGAWYYMLPRLRDLRDEMGSTAVIDYIGRPERASPAEGSADAHAEEQARIVNAAFAGVEEVVVSD